MKGKANLARARLEKVKAMKLQAKLGRARLEKGASNL